MIKLRHGSQPLEDDQSYIKETVGVELSTSQREQCICLNLLDNQLVFDISNIVHLMNESRPTKRSIIGLATIFYDPLGLLSPITIKFKVFFQQLCESKIDWDETLSG